MSSDKNSTEEIYDLFRKTFISSNREEIDVAEKRLKELANNFQEHFNFLLLSIQDNSVNNDLKLSMILYIKNLIKHKIEENTLTKDVLIELLRNFIEMILNVQFSDLNLTNISHCIELILKSEPICNSNVIDELQNFLFQNMNKIDNENKIKPIILLHQVVENSSLLHSENCYKIFTFILDSLYTILSFVLNKMQSLNFENIVNEISKFLYYVDIIENIFSCLYSIVIKTKKLDVFPEFLDTYQSKFLLSSIKLVCLTIPTISPTYIIIWTREKDFDTKINLMKIRCLQFISSILTSFKPAITNQELLVSVNMLIEIFTTNLDFVLKDKFEYISKMEKESKDFPDFNYSPFIYYIIQFYVIILTKEPIISNFLMFSHKFFVNYIFPFFFFTDREIEEMKTNGEQYNDFIMDLIDERKYRKIKTMTSQLMDKLCVKYDGFGNFLIGYCLQLLEYSLKSDSISNTSKEHLLSMFLTERILVNATQEQIIESCLLIFSVLTHIITKSKKLLSNLKSFLLTNLATLFNIQSEIVRSRLCFFLGFYIDELFTDEKDLIYVEKSIEYLLNNILLFHTKNEGLAFMASDTLNDLVNSKVYKIPIENIVLKNFMPLVDTIDSIEVDILFDIIAEIISNYTLDTPVLISVTKLTSIRILKEIKSPSIKNRKIEGHNVIITKCFSMLRTLCSNENFVLKNLNEIEGFLEPIFSYLKAPISFNFEDEIFEIMKKIMYHTKTLTTLSKNLFPNLIHYHKKHNFLNQEFFEVICCYITYGNDIVNNNEIFCQMLIDMFKLSVREEIYFDNPAMYSAITLQIWLQSTININIHTLTDILTLTITEIIDFLRNYNSKYQLEIYSDYLRFSNLVSIIYSAFVHYPLFTIDFIRKSDFYNSFLASTELHLKCSQYNSYNLKVITIGLCGLLTSDSNLANNEYLQLLNYLLSYLLRQKSEESKNLKIWLKKDIDCRFVEEHEEEYENDSEIKEKRPRLLSDCPYQEMNKKVSKMSPFDKLDEYEVFNQSILKMKQSAPWVIQEWLSKLSPPEQLILSNLISVRRIEVKNNEETYNIPRKILKIKKSNIN